MKFTILNIACTLSGLAWIYIDQTMEINNSSLKPYLATRISWSFFMFFISILIFKLVTKTEENKNLKFDQKYSIGVITVSLALFNLYNIITIFM